MKRASFIILCLLVSLTQAQTVSKEVHKRNIDTLNSEDPNVVTEFDKRLAKTYNWKLTVSDNPSGYKAWDKIDRIRRENEKKREDSLKTVANEKAAKEAEVFKAERLQTFTKKYGAKTGKKLANNEVWIGMSDKMVEDEFGAPSEVKRIKTATGTAETWTFFFPMNFSYLVFQNNKLIAIGE